jgi:ABC-type multidrug transport system permease subunit
LSKIVVLSVVSLAQCAVFIIIISTKYTNSEVDLEEPFQITLWMFLITIVSTLFGLTLSALSSNVEKVMGLIPIALIPQIMFSGIMVQFTTLYAKIPSFVLISRWAMTGICRIQEDIFSKLQSDNSVSSLDFMRSNLGYTYDNFKSPLFEGYILGIQCLFFFIVIYFIMKDKH